ncbi:MAG: HesA/MoeB/ThiF family protein [Bernardetiaceae bacterium]|jgi:adenylyltransferase/sulfurtransferase|nr:HesA/MoeB/ThiF family protein [Bernardetiaceae bacterium]
MSRYQRQLVLPQFGPAGQARLLAAKVLVVGAGGLGCPVLTYLAAAGVGTLGLVDGDRVAASNLHRQVLYTDADVGQPKARVAAQRLQALNPDVAVHPHPEFLTAQNALALLAPYDLVVDCSDNFATRYLVNDAAVLLGKPFVFGAIHQFEGQVAGFNLGPLSPTYRCLFPQPPAPHQVPNCAEAGVLGVVAGLVGLYQANEALKILAQLPGVLDGKLLTINLLDYTQRIIKLRLVIDKSQVRLLPDYEAYCQTTTTTPVMQTISAPVLAEALAAGQPWFLLDVREPWEHDLCHLPGAHLAPLGQLAAGLPALLAQLPAEGLVAVYCHHGVRSAHAISFLRQHVAPARLFNLTGGIHAWAEQVDAEMAVY